MIYPYTWSIAVFVLKSCDLHNTYPRISNHSPISKHGNSDLSHEEKQKDCQLLPFSSWTLQYQYSSNRMIFFSYQFALPSLSFIVSLYATLFSNGFLRRKLTFLLVSPYFDLLPSSRKLAFQSPRGVTIYLPCSPRAWRQGLLKKNGKTM